VLEQAAVPQLDAVVGAALEIVRGTPQPSAARELADALAA
jgi:hypothetical protein